MKKTWIALLLALCMLTTIGAASACCTSACCTKPSGTDKAQTMEEQQQDVLKFLPKIFGRDIRKIVMNRSYRNTMEIAQYANRLTGVSDIELFDRHGDAVEEMQFKNLHTALDRVLEKWYPYLHNYL